MKRTKLFALIVFLTTLPAVFATWAQTTSPECEPLIVFLVRHAEKTDADDDPELSRAGRERAATLRQVLRNAGLDYVHSSDTTRTRDTAAAVAEAFGLEVQLYDPRDLPGLVAKLRASGGRHLVVGHSNTTPALTGLLGGDPHSGIDEAAEYDRLYLVSIGADSETTSVLLRYGAAYVPLAP